MNRRSYEAVVIGASSGAIEAINTILPRLPEVFRLPVLIVVHLPPDHLSTLPELFQTRCVLPVKEAEDTESIQPGMIYIAPPDYHVLVEADGRISLSSEEPVQYSRPSIDVLFETAADAYQAALIGIVLTGANSDGASGLREIWKTGGTPIVQSPAEAQAPLMPESALAHCPAARVMTLNQIASFLIDEGGSND
ncbi:chemotaxis protein CheB [Rubinisphaera margarita]|uniref:chemotaxis protein CheB n=1 Tax=Rubinisphaera margarita TaxID=2909586 RepID=UPI001EE7985B|nr:chemotaxis protein CheB [Rubinisphaera margarita]MCG6156251.1 chemotaxis protein CheB [Rubinisphaera margarita]